MPAFLPEALVIGSGGFPGLMFVGALHRLYSEGYLEKVREMAGTSVGSILCLLLAIGYTPREIWNIARYMTLEHFMTSTQNFLRELGLYTTHALETFLQKLLEAKHWANPTFQEVFDQTGKGLFIPAYCNTTEEETIFSYLDTPDMPVVQAVLMSCTLPLIFSSYEYQGKHYIDGAVTCPYPVKYVDRGQPVLGLYLRETGQMKHKMSEWILGNSDEIMESALRSASGECQHICIYNTCLDFTGMATSDKERHHMVQMGEATVVLWLLQQRMPQDRSHYSFLHQSTLSPAYLEESDQISEESEEAVEYDTTPL